MRQTLTKITLWIVLIIVILLVTIGVLWYFSSKTTQEGTPGAIRSVLNLFPGFQIDTPEVIPEVVDTTPVVSTSTEVQQGIPRIRQISDTPVVGFGTFTKGATTTIRYMERATGNVFEARSDTLTLNRITNKTISNVLKAEWTNSTSSVVILTGDQNDVVTAFLVTIPQLNASSTPVNEVYTQYLTNYIEDIASSPSRDQVALLSQGTVVGINSKGVSKTLYTSPYRTWDISFPEANTLSLVTRASKHALGYAYTSGIGTNVLGKIAGDSFALQIKTAPNAAKSLISYTNGNKIEFGIIAHANKQITPVPLATFADKCVWNTSNTAICAVPIAILSNVTYPDDWYMGLTQTVDTLWSIDGVTGTIKLLTDFKELGGNTLFDITQLNVSSDNKYLYFINKRDLTLWSVRLSEE